MYFILTFMLYIIFQYNSLLFKRPKLKCSITSLFFPLQFPITKHRQYDCMKSITTKWKIMAFKMQLQENLNVELYKLPKEVFTYQKRKYFIKQIDKRRNLPYGISNSEEKEKGLDCTYHTCQNRSLILESCSHLQSHQRRLMRRRHSTGNQHSLGVPSLFLVPKHLPSMINIHILTILKSYMVLTKAQFDL